MNNPCVALEYDMPGLSIDTRADISHIVINSVITQPIILPEATKIFICVKNNAQVHLVAPNGNIELVLERGAQAYCYGLSNTRLNLCARVHAEANLAVANFNLGTKSSQSLINIELLEHEAETSFLGFDQLAQTQTSSLRLHIIHKTAHTKSTQSFRGIYAGESLGFFAGKVSVDPHAKNSAASQLYKALILSERARAHVKPELEINNFDITASHGASIGQLDKEALFYLCSRGLSKEAAQKILVSSLAQDILQEIHPVMRDFISAQVELSWEALHD